MERLMFGDIFNKKKVLVTGNTGFKGGWLTVWLLKLGATVYGISKNVPTEPSIFRELLLEDKITYFEQDVRCQEEMARIIGEVKPDFLFHLAAQSIVSLSYRDPLETITSNVVGTANILEGLRLSNHPCAAVIITSDKCYDNVEWAWGYRETDHLGGKDVYSGSKAAAEMIIKSYHQSFFKGSPVRVASARAGNVVGGGDWAADRIVPDCMRAWSRNEAVEIRSPEATRPWQHVLEPLGGYLALAARLASGGSLSGESFNFGPKAEHNHSVQKLIEDMSAYWKFADCQQSYKTTANSSFAEAGLLKLNCDKALHHLAWLPSLEYEQMIEYVSSWYYTFYQNSNDMYGVTLNQIAAYEKAAAEKLATWTR